MEIISLNYTQPMKVLTVDMGRERAPSPSSTIGTRMRVVGWNNYHATIPDENVSGYVGHRHRRLGFNGHLKCLYHLQVNR